MLAVPDQIKYAYTCDSAILLLDKHSRDGTILIDNDVYGSFVSDRRKLEPIQVSIARKHCDTRKRERSIHHGTLVAVRNREIMYTNKIIKTVLY